MDMEQCQLLPSYVREDKIPIKGKESIGLSKSEIEKLMKNLIKRERDLEEEEKEYLIEIEEDN